MACGNFFPLSVARLQRVLQVLGWQLAILLERLDKLAAEPHRMPIENIGLVSTLVISSAKVHDETLRLLFEEK